MIDMPSRDKIKYFEIKAMIKRDSNFEEINL